jgi:hypothetical protein
LPQHPANPANVQDNLYIPYITSKFGQVHPDKNDFSDDIMYPNIKVREKDESITQEPAGRAFMKEIVTRRVSLDLFTPETLEYIIDVSGGGIREYIRIIRDSAFVP